MKTTSIVHKPTHCHIVIVVIVGIWIIKSLAFLLLMLFLLLMFRLVSGSGDIKITKDGNVLLNEMVSS